jgi:hypothetical protein
MTAPETARRPLASLGVDLSFDQTVPRAIAHRRAVGEVFITDSAALGEDEFLLAFQLPRAHRLWSDHKVAYHDPFSTGEAARQGSFVVIHRHLGVPLSLPFSLQRYAFTVHELAAFRDDQRSPLEGLLRYRIVSQHKRGDELGSLSIEGDLEIGGALALTVSGDVVFLPRGDYEALRAFQRSRKPLDSAQPPGPIQPLDAAAVGRLDQRNVVIGHPVQAGRTDRAPQYPLVIDLGHPSYFDHSYDHVPGPFIVEGFRQAALVEAHRTGALASPVAALVGCRTSFADFGEFEAILEYSAEVQGTGDGRVQVRVELHQFGKEIAEGEIELSEYPER